jgi:hypothetical protein
MLCLVAVTDNGNENDNDKLSQLGARHALRIEQTLRLEKWPNVDIIWHGQPNQADIRA